MILGPAPVERATPTHKKQARAYLRLTGRKLECLLDLGDDVMRTGVTRYLHGPEE